jgi:hypothetical protein
MKLSPSMQHQNNNHHRQQADPTFTLTSLRRLFSLSNNPALRLILPDDGQNGKALRTSLYTLSLHPVLQAGTTFVIPKIGHDSGRLHTPLFKNIISLILSFTHSLTDDKFITLFPASLR